MYTYSQSKGRLVEADGALVGIGIAGQGAGLNNPVMQGVHNIGPLPQGFYTIQAPYHHPKLGPVTMDLVPDINNEMFGRSLFRIHGFAEHEPSSEGCITQHRPARDYVALHLTTDNRVQVIA